MIGCGSHDLSAQNAQRTKSNGPKGLQPDIWAWRAPGLQVNNINHKKVVAMYLLWSQYLHLDNLVRIQNVPSSF